MRVRDILLWGVVLVTFAVFAMLLAMASCDALLSYVASEQAELAP